MAGYVTALPDADAARACGASLAALWSAGGQVLLDASVWPNRDDAAAADDRVAAFVEAATSGESRPWVLPQVISEAMGMLRSLPEPGAAVALLRASTHTPSGVVLDTEWIRKCVRFLDALDRSESLSKEPGAKGRRTDLRLVATALHEVWLRQAATVIATRDEDIRRLAQGAASWNAAQASPRPAPAVRVFKLDRDAGVYRCYFDGAADPPPPLVHPEAAEPAEAWAAIA